MTNKVLFILKRKENYGLSDYSSGRGLSTGLFNSATFVNDMLNDVGIESNLEVAIDNNCIDSFVTKHKPTHVIIEALWVVPEKFKILIKLHPSVKWIVRLHSEIPFISGEGIFSKWILNYVKYDNVQIAVNAPRILKELKHILKHKDINDKLIYLPNYYPQTYKKPKVLDRSKEYIDISSFGAIRLLKNQLLQAISAIKFADNIGKKLRFHVNGGRLEMIGDSVIRNLRELFDGIEGHELVEHAWSERDEFLKLCETMDIGMQVSFSETFNIVSADHISQGVPMVVSDEVPWSSFISYTDPNSSDSIISALYRAYILSWFNVWLNQNSLTHYTNETKWEWTNYFVK